MAAQAQCADVRKVAGTSAFHHGHFVVRVPESPAVEGLQSPGLKQAKPRASAASADLVVSGDRVRRANCTYAFVSFEGLLTQERRVRTKTPLGDTEVRTERLPPLRHFEITPATEIAASLAFRQIVAASNPASLERAFLAHFALRRGARFAGASSAAGGLRAGAAARLRCKASRMFTTGVGLGAGGSIVSSPAIFD